MCFHLMQQDRIVVVDPGYSSDHNEPKKTLQVGKYTSKVILEKRLNCKLVQILSSPEDLGS